MRPRRTPGTRGGQALVEFAVVLPLFLFCLIGALDAGLWAVQTSAEVSAVEQAAMVASSAGSSPTSETAPDARAVLASVSSRLRSALFGRRAKLVRDNASGDCAPDRPRSGARRRPGRCSGRGWSDGWSWCASARPTRRRARRLTARTGHLRPYPRRLRRDSPMITVRVVGFVASVRAGRGFGPRAGRRIRAPGQHLGNDSHAAFRSVSALRDDSGAATTLRPSSRPHWSSPSCCSSSCNFIAVMVQVDGPGAAQLGHRARGAVALPGSRGMRSIHRERAAAALLERADDCRPAHRVPVRGRDLLRNHDDLHRPAPLAAGDALHVRRRQRERRAIRRRSRSRMRDLAKTRRCRATSAPSKSAADADSAGSTSLPASVDDPWTSAQSSGRPRDVSSTCDGASPAGSLDFANTPLPWGVFWTPAARAQARGASASVPSVTVRRSRATTRQDVEAGS